jgi:hypothetical protein
MTPATLRESAAVRRWLDRSGHAAAPADQQDELLAQLADFCAHTGRTPEELIESCFRQTAAGTAISAKGRRRMQETIDGFVAHRGLHGHEAIVTGNHIRGFLVHNGVFIQGRVSIR